MSMLGTKQPTAKDYKDGRTKQAFNDETDINKILRRAEKTGTISHLNKHEAHYGDFTGFDFLEAQLKLTAGSDIFAELPAEVRSEFNQNPAEFFDYVNDPENKERLGVLLPALAEPGRQLPRATGVIPADAVQDPEPPAIPAPNPTGAAPDAAPVVPPTSTEGE